MSLEDLVVFNIKSLNFHYPGIKKVGEIIPFHLQLFLFIKIIVLKPTEKPCDEKKLLYGKCA